MLELAFGLTGSKFSQAWEGNQACLGTQRGVLGMYPLFTFDGYSLSLASCPMNLGLFYSEYSANRLRLSRHTLIPPRGYSIAGVSGSCGPWVDGFSLIITR